jgi:nucleotide-binding universal stress UspA family protein
MKKILVPTDFSPSANNAARYALHLAAGLKASITLCNAMLVPAEAPEAAQVAWPLLTYEDLKDDTDEQLQYEIGRLSERLDQQSFFNPESFRPELYTVCEAGPVTDVVRATVDEQDISLVVMGMSGAGSLERFIIGTSTRSVIAKAGFPVLLIPSGYIFQPVKSIAFATDLSNSDINVLHTLACFAKAFDADIQVYHITDAKSEIAEDKLKADIFMKELCKKISYSKIHYHHIKSIDVDHGLTWLNEHGAADIIAMVHRPHNFLGSLFAGSHTQRLARHVTLPLLVLPPAYGAII